MSHGEELEVTVSEEDAALTHPEGSDESTPEPQETVAEKREPAAADQQQLHAGGGEEGKGVKRKREEPQSENELEGSSKQVTTQDRFQTF